MSVFSPIFRAALVALVFATASQSWATDGLTLADAQHMAQARSRQLVADAALASAAREQAVAAGQLPDPVLKAGLNSLPVDGPDRFSLTRDSFTMFSVGVMQEFTRGDKRRARSARFEREAEVAQAGRMVALARLLRDTASAWLDRYYLERIQDVLRTQRVEAGLQIEAADAAYRGGRGAQADVFAARSAVAQIDDRIRSNDSQLAMAKTRLARWVGDDGNRDLGAPPSLASLLLDAGSLETELEHHPRIAFMARQEAVARAEADIAQSNQRSDWSVELTYSQRGAAYSNMISLNVSIPLQWDRKNRQDRELAAKLALAEQLRAQREEATRDDVAEVRGWLQEWRGNRDRLANFDQALVPLAAERTRAAMAAYRGGGGPLSAVLEARRMEIDIRLDRLRLEMQTAGLWAQLNYLIPDRHDVATATEK